MLYHDLTIGIGPAFNDDSGNSFVTPKLRNEVKKLMVHVEKGCLSDPPGVWPYIKIGVDADGLDLYKSYRGTSIVESFHQKVDMNFQPWCAGPEFADAALAILRHRHNVRERHRPNFLKLGHYDHFLVDEIQATSLRLTGNPIYIQCKLFLQTLCLNSGGQTQKGLRFLTKCMESCLVFQGRNSLVKTRRL